MVSGELSTTGNSLRAADLSLRRYSEYRTLFLEITDGNVYCTFPLVLLWRQNIFCLNIERSFLHGKIRHHSEGNVQKRYLSA